MRAGSARYRDVMDELSDADDLTRALWADLRVGLPGDMLRKVDSASMYHALEVRVPMLDPRVVELAFSLPGEVKTRGNQVKALLVDAHRDMLPPEVFTRAKMGFEMPIGEWLGDELAEMWGDLTTPDACRRAGIFDHDAVRNVYRNHCEGRRENAFLLWAILAIQWWARRTEALV